MLVGSADLHEPTDEDAPYDESFDWDVKDGNLRDVKLATILRDSSPKVISIIADSFGGFEMHLEQAHILSVFPTLTRKFEYGEYWRVFNLNEDNSDHFVTSALELSRL